MYDTWTASLDNAPELEHHQSESFSPPQAHEPEGPLPWQRRRLQKGCEKAAGSDGWHKWRKKFHWKDRAEASDRQRVSDLREAKRQRHRDLLGLRLPRQTRA